MGVTRGADFHLFRETGLAEQRFHTNEEFRDTMETYLNTLLETFYEVLLENSSIGMTNFSIFTVTMSKRTLIVVNSW